MTLRAFELWNEKLSKSQAAELVFVVGNTAAKTVSNPASAPIEVFFDTAAGNQATIDALLGSSSEFVAATALGSTAMGTDAVALVIDCDGQIAELLAVQIESAQTAGGTPADSSRTILAQATAPADTLTAAAYKSSAGNLIVRAVLGNLDSVTSGALLVRALVKLK